MSNITIILCGVFVGVLWIIARNIVYKEGFKNGYEQGEKDFKPRKDDDKSCGTCKHYDKWWDDIVCDGCTKAHSNWEREEDE